MWSLFVCPSVLSVGPSAICSRNGGAQEVPGAAEEPSAEEQAVAGRSAGGGGSRAAQAG